MLVILVLALALVVGLCGTSRAAPLGTAFMYQNLLIDGNDVLDGPYDLMVSLFDDPNGGKLRGTVLVDDLDVNGGWFEIMLDFGDGVFDGSNLWLEFATRPGEMDDPNVYVTLWPRYPILVAPYALYAINTGPIHSLDAADGSPTEVVYVDNAGEVGIGTKSPGAKLDVDGQIMIRGGLPGNGKVLISDANGLASWQTLAGGDITEVSAGTGLSGGGTTGTVTLAVQVPLILSAPVDHPEGIISVLNSGTGDGVNGNAVNGAGVTGDHLSTGNFGKLGTSEGGVMGLHNATGNWGALGASLAGVWGRGSPFAGQFAGNVRINGDLAVDGTLNAGQFGGNVRIDGDLAVGGTLFKAGGSFKIDHPLDPENKYLSHSFVESPDMMNVYNGNVTLDENGRVTVRVPEYFEALNRDFRYQLTAIGAPGPNLYITEKISDNCFKIAGGKPGMEISWQVTGIRHDPYAVANRIAVEEVKPTEER